MDGRWIDPATLMRIRSLELRARAIVEGSRSGTNRSPWHGFSVEFTEYRPYSPGDDLRYLDWRLFARSDRYCVKRFEDETNLRCHILLDASRSMDYGSLPYTKMDYARTLAATLGYFLHLQGDAVGLARFAAEIEELIPARHRPGHLRRLLVALEKRPAGTETDLARPLETLAERLTRRGLVVLISDLLAPIDALAPHLSRLRFRGHEVLVFHILDPAEARFEFDAVRDPARSDPIQRVQANAAPSIFRDIESGRELHVDPAAVRESYLRRLAEHEEAIRAACARLGVEYRRFVTDEPLEIALTEFLHARDSAGRRPFRRPRSAGRAA
ncbi:MAG: DUF58 domain-containing protein [Planctomycetaceae bacterium]